MNVTLKRVYEPAEPSDGYRILVDRLWPRGLSKERAALDLWFKEVAPSPELRKRWHQASEPWEHYAAEYQLELENNPAVKTLVNLLAEQDNTTLLYGAADPQANHARVLLAHLEKLTA